MSRPNYDFTGRNDVLDLIYCSLDGRVVNLGYYVALHHPNEQVRFYIDLLEKRKVLGSFDLELCAKLLGGFSLMTTDGSYVKLGRRIKL